MSFPPHRSHWNPLGVDLTVPARKIPPTGRHGWGGCKCSAAAVFTRHRWRRTKGSSGSGFGLGLREIHAKAMALRLLAPQPSSRTEELSQTLDLLNASVLARNRKTCKASAQWGHVCALDTCVIVHVVSALSWCMWCGCRYCT